MKLRFGTPKYGRTSSGLFALGLGLVFVSRYIGTTLQTWLMAVGWLVVAGGMAVLVAGIRAARRDWEAAHKTESQ
jgi:protein-S-isoprenylcysteine O-methyltransferase Ste14